MSSEFPVNFGVDKHLYIPICTDAEIRRICVVKNSEDYLLKLRADIAYLIVRIWNATLPKFIDKKKSPGDDYRLRGFVTFRWLGEGT